MKTKYSSKNKNEPIRGWTIQDQRLLREFDPARSPKTQIFAYSEPDSDSEEKPSSVETITKYCDKCENYNLRFFDLLHCWYCYSCGNKVKPDTPVPKSNPELFMASVQQGPYPVYNENDPTIPFIETIDLNREDQKDNPDIELVRESQNGRIRHYKVRDGGQAAALSAVNEVENRNRN